VLERELQLLTLPPHRVGLEGNEAIAQCRGGNRLPGDLIQRSNRKGDQIGWQGFARGKAQVSLPVDIFLVKNGRGAYRLVLRINNQRDIKGRLEGRFIEGRKGKAG